MPKHLLPIVAALVTAAATAGVAAADHHGGGGTHRHEGVYALGLWGDVPYSDVQKGVGCRT
jgi:hypothetical protein